MKKLIIKLLSKFHVPSKARVKANLRKDFKRSQLGIYFNQGATGER